MSAPNDHAGHRLLADVLATDVQNFPPFVEEIEAAIRAARAGGQDARRVSGNLYALVFQGGHVTIANARDHRVAPETVTIDAFEAAMRAQRTPRA